MKTNFLTAIVIYLLPLLAKSQNYIEWDKNTKLNYNNFKRTPDQTKSPQGVLDMRMGWQIAQGNGQVPELYVQNKVDQNSSWLSMKNQEILNDMQLQFDLSELYARKIRKEFEVLRAKKEMSKDVYKARFMAVQKNFQKRLKSVATTTLNQPTLYKLLNKQIQDSLVIYNDYQKK